MYVQIKTNPFHAGFLLTKIYCVFFSTLNKSVEFIGWIHTQTQIMSVFISPSMGALRESERNKQCIVWCCLACISGETVAHQCAMLDLVGFQPLSHPPSATTQIWITGSWNICWREKQNELALRGWKMPVEMLVFSRHFISFISTIMTNLFFLSL